MNYLKLPAVLLTLFTLISITGKSQAQDLNDSQDFKLAGYQMIISNDIDSNRKKILAGMQNAADFIVHCINSGTDQKYRAFHESSAELWSLTLKIPILEINASFGEQPVNARSGFIDSKGERINIVPDTGEHIFVTPVKMNTKQD